MENKKDWVGNGNSIFKTLGASSHTDKEREQNDFYATDPIAGKLLLEAEEFGNVILDNSVGEGHLMIPFLEAGKTVLGMDLVERPLDPRIRFKQQDFLEYNPEQKLGVDIVCNPPYSEAANFVEHSIDIVREGQKVCFFLKLQFLEGKKRKELFKNYPPKTVYVSSSRILCAKNADFQGMKDGGGSAVAYAWYVWEKGYQGDTKIKWFN